LLTISEELEHCGRLEEAGGPAYLTGLVTNTPHSLNVEEYVRIVSGKSQERWVLSLAQRIADSSSNPSKLRDLLSNAATTFERRNQAHEFKPLTADEILNQEWPEPVWAVPGILPVGLTILAGKPKVGKSWLALQIAQAVAAGGIALGQQVSKGRVLYLALEDPPRRIKDRMQKQHWQSGLEAEFMVMGTYLSELGNLTNGGGRRIASLMKERLYRVVVIDTLSRSVRGDQCSPEEMTAALEPIQQIAHEYNCAVTLIDHHRKSVSKNPDAILDILGSTAKGAVLDTAMGLYREGGKSGAKLQITGRDIEERTLPLIFDRQTGCWQIDEQNAGHTERQQEILDCLKEVGALGGAEIARTIAQDRANTYRRLQDLVNEGAISKNEEGLYVLP
jgi:RecA-family ATPase